MYVSMRLIIKQTNKIIEVQNHCHLPNTPEAVTVKIEGFNNRQQMAQTF